MTLRELREFAGYSLADAGKLVGVSAVAVFKMEKAENTQSETAKRLSNIYREAAGIRMQKFIDAISKEDSEFLKHYSIIK